jgi:hypothetical protein
VLRHIYRTIILICIFVAALSYFSRDIKEVVFDFDNTTVMKEATFPLVTLKQGENRINRLHGYSSNLNANKVRESITPLNADQSFEVLINQEAYDIKKMNYELRDFVDNRLIESGSVSVFEDNGKDKTAKIKFNTELPVGKEYTVKITLITSESLKMYYYQRVKVQNNLHLAENLKFIMEFHHAIRNKSTAEQIKQYLEPSSKVDNSSLAYVNINSSFDLITWGNLNPKFITEVIPTIKEVYTDMALVELKYMIEAEVAGKKELYQITEFYRVRYSPKRIYLLNYERRMEAAFDIKLASVSQSQLKLGITSDLNVPFVAGNDKLKLAFVRNRELWFYNLQDNQITKVFSFRQENTDYIRDLYDQHDIRILNMDAEGNINFLIYGYMNRGQYEGRVAVILYRYIRAENRIEEQVYLPVEETYQTLKENLGTFAYVNSQDIFYFNINNSLYSYSLITRKLSVLATNIHQDQIVFIKNKGYVAWQENSDPKVSKNIRIMNLETEEIQSINSQTGYNIRLMDMIDSNLIYGFIREGDITTMMDGSILAPLSTVNISTFDKKILKSYSKPDYYISALEVKGNIVDLIRVNKVIDNGRTTYVPASKDYIMNQGKEEPLFINVTTRVTDQALTEAYLTLPGGFVMEQQPRVKTTVNTIITQDPTVRLEEPQNLPERYYPYVTGGIQGAYDNAADAIAIANRGIGVVLNNRQQLVWERVAKPVKNVITEFEAMTRKTSGNTIESCIALMLEYQKVSVDKTKLSVKDSSAYDVLLKCSKKTPVRLTGITLEEVLYYVAVGRPVLALTGPGNAVLIYGYDAFNIMVVDPKTNKLSKIGLQDSAHLFEEAGNVFLSYLE